MNDYRDSIVLGIITWLSILLSLSVFLLTLLDLLGVLEVPFFSDRIAKVTLLIIALYWTYLAAVGGLATQASRRFTQLDRIERAANETPYRVLTSLRSSVPFHDGVSGTDFAFLAIAQSATRSIFAVGPNLHYFVVEPAVKKLIFQKLKQPKFSVRLLISDPDSQSISEVMSQFALTPDFTSELQSTVAAFRQWREQATRRRLKPLQFQPKKADVVTISLLFIDAEDAKLGTLVLIPIPWQVEGGNRPAFLIKRRDHPSAFNKYYDAYDRLFTSSLSEDL